jgi:hypothetical protein
MTQAMLTSTAVVGLVCVQLSVPAAGESNYYPLTAGAEWTYVTDIVGTISVVTLTNEGTITRGKRRLHIQRSRAEGQLIETKFIEANNTGVYLAGVQRRDEKPQFFRAPRALMLVPTNNNTPRWHGGIEESILCNGPVNGTLTVSVEGEDEIVSRGSKTKALRVKSRGNLSQACGDNTTPIEFVYEDLSWFGADIGLLRSVISVTVGNTTQRSTIDLRSFRRPTRKPPSESE